MSAAEPSFVSVFDETLGVSALAPLGWSRASSDVFPLQLKAPSLDNFRASCNFSHEHFEPATPDGLATFVARMAQTQVADYEGFAELARDEFVVDNRPGLLQHYTWTPEALGRPMRQILGIIVVEPGLVLEVDAVTLDSHAEEYLPLFQRIMESIRIVG